ncbi:MAG: hypothetical protein HUU20_03260, partial [Pirellulales bacterium]|nr:hypothetical protein [Pirellulales bacterium]
TLDRLRDTRQRTGLDGLWLDSYNSATHVMDTAVFADAVRQADGLLPWQAQVENLGYTTYCEGGPTAIGTVSTSGWQPPDEWSRFRPETLYKCGLYLQQAGDASKMSAFLSDPRRRPYYRMLANLCCPILDPGHFGLDRRSLERIGQANRDFNAVADLMQVRRLLDFKGVEWSSAEGRAVFAFDTIDYPVPPGMALCDVTEDKAVPLPENRRVTLAPYHTYRATF